MRALFTLALVAVVGACGKSKTVEDASVTSVADASADGGRRSSHAFDIAIGIDIGIDIAHTVFVRTIHEGRLSSAELSGARG